jgi:hypothetical protein
MLVAQYPKVLFYVNPHVSGITIISGTGAFIFETVMQ